MELNKIDELAKLSEDLARTKKQILRKEFSANDTEIKFSGTNIKLTFDSTYTTEGYLLAYVMKIIQEKSSELVSEAKLRFQKDYEEDLNDLKIASINFATNSNLKIYEEK